MCRTSIPRLKPFWKVSDEDDKQNSDAINQDGDAFVAAELKKAVKAIGKNPASDFERGLVQAQKLFDETKKLEVRYQDQAKRVGGEDLQHD